MRALLSAGPFLPRHLYAQRPLQQRQALQPFPLLPRREQPQQSLLEGQNLVAEAGAVAPPAGCLAETLESAARLVRLCRPPAAPPHPGDTRRTSALQGNDAYDRTN